MRTKTGPLHTPKALALTAALHVTEFGREGPDFLIVFRGGVTFDALATISEIFGGTKKIDIGSETRDGGFCETCAYTYSVAVVFVRGKAAEGLADDPSSGA